MARTPNYDFERRERERHKKLKTAERAQAKLEPTVEEGKIVMSDKTSGQD